MKPQTGLEALSGVTYTPATAAQRRSLQLQTGSGGHRIEATARNDLQTASAPLAGCAGRNEVLPRGLAGPKSMGRERQ